MDITGILKERVNWRTLAVAFGFALAGLVLIFRSEGWKWSLIGQNVGGLLLVSGTIAGLLEIWVKRAFLDEILALISMSKDLALAGVTLISETFHNDQITWNSYFENAKTLDIFFAYAHSWRNRYKDELREAIRQGTRIRVVLPAVDDDITIDELSRRFQKRPEDLRQLIAEARDYFVKMRSIPGARVEIWFLPCVPAFSFYLFDKQAIVSLHTHRPEQVNVPTFICLRSGTFYKFIKAEFEAMVGGQAKLYEPNEGQPDA